MSNTTVPQIIASSSDTYTSADYPAPIRLQVRRDLGAGEVPAADVYLTEDGAAEIITDLALALEATASYGALVAVILAEFEHASEDGASRTADDGGSDVGGGGAGVTGVHRYAWLDEDRVSTTFAADLDPLGLATVGRVLNAIDDGREFLVIFDDDLVRSVEQLSHEGSPLRSGPEVAPSEVPATTVAETTDTVSAGVGASAGAVVTPAPALIEAAKAFALDAAIEAASAAYRHGGGIGTPQEADASYSVLVKAIHNLAEAVAS